MTFDNNNIFARIIRGEIPCHKVYEDEHALAFMDIMPQADGHCLVIPKQGCRNLLDANDTTLANVMPAVRKVAAAAMRAFETEGVQIRQNNEAGSGQTVFHLHFNVLPRNEGVPLKPHTGKMADPTMLAKHAEMIRAAL